MANSNKSARHSSQDLSNMLAAAWTRTFFSHRSWVAAAMATMAALAFLSVIPLHHWHRLPLTVLLVSSGVALMNALIRIMIGERLPRWTLHLDVIFGNVFISLAVASAATDHVDLANLYLFVIFFAFLYLPIRVALLHLCAAGIVYAAILSLGTPPLEPAGVAWLSVFGTGIALGAVVAGLVSVLRINAREDSLTGLANRRMWDERLEEEVERAKRTGEPLSVIMIDLDDFKAVNDSKGHDAGDRLLTEIATSYKKAVRSGGDFLARLGGDEFAVLAPGSGEIGVRGLATRLTDSLPSKISASVGVATWDSSESASELLRRADIAMYQVKQRRHSHGPRPA